MHFGAQNAFWAPKCSLAKRGQGGHRLFRTAVVKIDVSKCDFCENSEKFAEFCVVGNSLNTIPTFFEILI